MSSKSSKKSATKSSKSSKASKKTTTIKAVKMTPTPLTNTAHAATIDVHRVLGAIAHSTSVEDIYSFLISDLSSKIKENAMNATYWKNQVAYLKKHEDDKVGYKSYQLMIKDNQTTNQQYQKAMTSLKKAQQHFNKGSVK